MYYCYISHEKVIQLLSRYNDNDIEESIEKRENRREKKGDIGVGRLFQFINFNASYGRSDIYHKELKMRENITQKLIRLLELIAPEVKDFDSKEKLHQSQFYYFQGEFKVNNIDRQQNMVTIENVAPDYSIVLHCSLKYFSSNTDFSKPIEINSSNYAFLNGLKPVPFETVFLNIGEVEDRKILGTPIFLMLSDLNGNL